MRIFAVLCTALLCVLTTFSYASDATDVCHPTKNVAKVKALPDLEQIKLIKLDSYATGVVWSPDGHQLATSEDSDRVIKVWDARDFHILQIIHKENKGSNRLLYSVDGKYLITSSQAGYDGVNRTVVSIIDVATGKNIKNVDGPHDPKDFPRANVPHDFVLSPDGKLLYVTFNTRDRVAHIYKTETWTEVGTFPTIAAVMRGGPQNDQVTLVDYATGMAHIWSFSKQRYVGDIKVLSKPEMDIPEAIALDSTSCRSIVGIGMRTELCVTNCEGKIGVKSTFTSDGGTQAVSEWNLITGKKISEGSDAKPKEIRWLELNSDGTLLVASDENDYATVLYDSYDLSSSKVIHEFKAETWSSAFSPDGKSLAVAGDNEVLIYNIKPKQ